MKRNQTFFECHERLLISKLGALVKYLLIIGFVWKYLNRVVEYNRVYKDVKKGIPMGSSLSEEYMIVDIFSDLFGFGVITMRYITFFLLICLLSSQAFAFEAAPPLTDREILSSLVESRGGLDTLNARFDDMNRRLDGSFDHMNRRFEGRFDDVNRRFDDLKGLLYVILAGIFALFGFVLWDRRTALAPAIKKTKELEEKEEMIEKVLRELARQDPKVKDAMKHAGFM